MRSFVNLLLFLPFCWTEVVEFSVDGGGSVEEVRSASGFVATFRNEGQKPVDLHWSDGQSFGIWQGTLEAGNEFVINTYPGHEFFYSPKSYRRKLKIMKMNPRKSVYTISQAEITRFDGPGCVDRHHECVNFARRDGSGCEENPGWMIVNCAKTCNITNPIRDYCVLRDTKTRCNPEALNYTQTPGLTPGAIEERFSTMEERFPEYTPKALSKDPWVMQFDTFLTHEECHALEHTVGPFERSTDTGAKNEHGEAGRVLSKGRTSSNAWCRSRCENHPAVRKLVQKIVQVTEVPYTNYESFQVLQYESGQFYNTHHDRGGRADKDITGGRILTFFLYCSDVEEGGETEFPRLNLKVKPKKGRAILWPSVKNAMPTKTDSRTSHGALPVKKGLKIAANAWIHQFNFQIPNLWGCTGSFD